MNRKLAAAVQELARNRAEAASLARGSKRLFSKNRKKALKLDNDTCRMCSFTLCLEVHHVVPLAEGGSHKVGNLITLCPNHHAMADRNLIPLEELETFLARRTCAGRQAALIGFVEQAAMACMATGNDRGKLDELYRKLKTEIPEQFMLVYGHKRVSASLGSFRLIPPSGVY